jgi:calcineurin-like phosphoesterase family protein
MEVFLIADTHFGHRNIINFTRDDGSSLRPFSDTEKMDEALIDGWNKIISAKDKVYHLGDVAIPRSGLQCLDRLNGKKVLIKGNHDRFKAQEYLAPLRFTDIKGSHELNDFILTHIPIHPNNFLYRIKGNIHGHLHYRRVMNTSSDIDERYQCVCVEHTNYVPISFDDVLKKFRNAGVI